ncbi:MAG: uracil-DNA glycosylase [Planctomycetota bacterium]
MPRDTLRKLERDTVACELCPRLREWCATVAREKRRAFRDRDYWGKPVPGFGDPAARLIIVGLAPGAHGSNRTGRPFTGDASGDWLYDALHRHGFASQPASIDRDDGLELTDCWITAVGRCAPPQNKPTPAEIANCRPFLERELKLLKQRALILALGKIAFDGYLNAVAQMGQPTPKPRPKFGHGVVHDLPGHDLPILATYHPSRQNTQTGRLTRPMWNGIFRTVRKLLDG